MTVCLNSFGQKDFKKEVDNIYNFYPHKLSKTEQQQVFPIVDKFFEKIKSDTSKFLPLLRQELKSDGHFPYFYYDCSHLLMILSKSHSDKKLCGQALSKCDIKDLDPRSFVVILKSLAIDNIDVTKAAVKILEDPTFHFILPEHAMKFNQGYCLMYCLLPLDPSTYVGTLTKVFQQTKDLSAQKSIVTTLWFSYSCSGDKFLKSLNEANTLSKEVSDYSKRLLANTKIPKEAEEYFKVTKEEDLVAIEKSALTRFSDEAIDELDFVTKTKRKKYNCR